MSISSSQSTVQAPHLTYLSSLHSSTSLRTRLPYMGRKTDPFYPTHFTKHRDHELANHVASTANCPSAPAACGTDKRGREGECMAITLAITAIFYRPGDIIPKPFRQQHYGRVVQNLGHPQMDCLHNKVDLHHMGRGFRWSNLGLNLGILGIGPLLGYAGGLFKPGLNAVISETAVNLNLD
ncbi:hypothetical protein GGX14DRAFT_407348 [Mycena pura]|uniref:Uncharacterized protein n=1 Tax=Mycena pura TaxID=153505 RepID=A0AAD6URH3_9AGAR|nr:hypothetical protein GGX14DRAFT_407348 [Mycena pura]